MRKPVSLIAVALLAAGCGAMPAAQSATCTEAVVQLAQQYGLSTELPRLEAPATEDSRGVPPDVLSQSGGVLAPPAQGAGRVQEPQPGTRDAMPTAPPAPPHSAQAPSRDAQQLDAVKRAQMQSLLQAARAAGRSGDEQRCWERLGAAKAIPQQS
jgi:hypothetical protein